MELTEKEYAQLLIMRAKTVAQKLDDDSPWSEVKKDSEGLEKLVAEINSFLGRKLKGLL